MTTQENRSTPRWLGIAILLCAFWVMYLALLGPRPRAPQLGDTGKGEPASYSWGFRDLQDRPASFAQFRGKTVFLNIWATWCGPCVQEMPSIARLADDPRLRGKDVAFVCVSVDDATETVRHFLEGRSWKMQFFRTEGLPPVFLTEGIPATFLIGPDGKIAAKQVGSARWDGPETVALLEELASGKRPSP